MSANAPTHYLLRSLTVAALMLWPAANPLMADEPITVRGVDPSITVIAELADAYEQKTGHRVHVEGGGSSDGPQSSLELGVDLVFTPDSLSQEQTQAGLVGFPYGFDAVAVVVNQDNPTEDLSLEQVRAIFADQVAALTNPSAFTATDPDSWDAQAFFQQQAQATPADPQPSPAFPAIPSTDQGTAATTYSALAELGQPDQVRPLAIDGIAPTPETIRSQRYPLSRSLNLVSQGQPNPTAQAFIDFVLSEEGQQIVQNAGLVPTATPGPGGPVQTASVETEGQE